MFSRLRRPTRCWLRIQIAPSSVGGLTNSTSTVPGGLLDEVSVCTSEPASGKCDGRSGGRRRVPRLLEMSGVNSILGVTVLGVAVDSDGELFEMLNSVLILSAHVSAMVQTQYRLWLHMQHSHQQRVASTKC